MRQVALKCADVGHLALPTELHKVWVGRLQDEFYLQGDVERDRGMPISALMDRDKPSNIANSQACHPVVSMHQKSSWKCQKSSRVAAAGNASLWVLPCRRAPLHAHAERINVKLLSCPFL